MKNFTQDLGMQIIVIIVLVNAEMMQEEQELRKYARYVKRYISLKNLMRIGLNIALKNVKVLENREKHGLKELIIKIIKLALEVILKKLLNSLAIIARYVDMIKGL